MSIVKPTRAYKAIFFFFFPKKAGEG